MNTSTDYYIAGGTMGSNAPSYVTREADNDLYDHLKEGRFCYVLTSRQMGKSSLMIRTRAKLIENDFATVVLDLQKIGQNLTVEQWYDGLITELAMQLNMEDQLEEYWLANSRLSYLQRWLNCLRIIVLPSLTKKLVVFIDEIDYVRSLPFSTDEFFAGIRELFNERSQIPHLQNLTFCLFGVASPSDLISDPRTTPFNIGNRIELNDFSMKEAIPLIKGLNRSNASGKILMNRILYWTGGHPYLTQKFCQSISENSSVKTLQDVDDVCEKLFISSESRAKDDNLIFVRERILRSELNRADLLDLYSKIYTDDDVRDDRTNPLINTLRLSGITRTENGNLKIRNRIYEEIFDETWILTNMPDAEVQRQKEAYRAGVRKTIYVATAISIAVIVIVVMATLTIKSRVDFMDSSMQKQQLENKINSLIDENLKLQIQIHECKYDWNKENLEFKNQLESLKTP